MTSTSLIQEDFSNDIVIDTYHGIDVADPFRWLEDHQSPRTCLWIAEQAEVSRNYLDRLPGRDRLQRRLTELLDIETILEIRTSGNSIFYMKRVRGEQQAKLYRRDGIYGEEILLIDPVDLNEGHALSITILDVSTDGKLLAFGLRKGGQGARRVRILKVDTGETLLDELPLSAIRGFGFLPGNNGFLYVTEETDKRYEPKTVRRHFFGRPFDSDKIIFYAGRASNIRLVSDFYPKSDVAVHTVIRALKGSNFTSIYIQMLGQCGSPLMALVEDSPNPWEVSLHGDELFMLIPENYGDIRRLVRVPLDNPDVALARIVLIEGSQRIQQWRVFGDRILTNTVHDLSSVLCSYNLAGDSIGTIRFPEPGTANILDGDNSGCFFSFESYTRPLELRHLDFSTDKITVLCGAPDRFTHIATRHVEYTSEDGTSIPLTLLGENETLDKGRAPILLTAYGAAGVALTPQFSFLATCFIELGGVFSLAHVRGGGDFGFAWEEAGRRRKRQTVHKDFFAARDFLVASGIADENRIAIVGGSNSGLLVCTAMTQRPSAFRAVLCLVPLTDMFRYHKFDNTQFYIPLFGSVDDPEDFEILREYSPYHNVRDGVVYPALLMVSGDLDTRCDPMHARKFVARIQSATKDLPAKVHQNRPLLLEWNRLRGHFATMSIASRVAAIVDRLAFLCEQLDMEIV